MGNNLNKKTILYVTVNTINWKIYVGVHDVDENNENDYYIGDGVYINKPSTIKHPKCPFHYAIKKYGFKAFRRFTLLTFDSREEALKFERLIVNEEFIARKDTYNVVLGGGNPPRNDIECYMYSFDGTFIKKYNSLQDAAVENNLKSSVAIRNAIMNKTSSCGHFWTDCYIEKLDVSNYCSGLNNKEVHMYNEDGKYLSSFESIGSAAKELCVTLSSMQRAIKNQTKIKNKYFSIKKVDVFIKYKVKKHNGNQIHQYSLNGEYIKSFNSVSEVVRQLGKTYQGIPASIRLGRTCGNYQWSWEKVHKKKNLEQNINKSKKIGQYTLDGKLVKIYDTLRGCRKDFGNVGKVLKGFAKQAKGYTFKYID